MGGCKRFQDGWGGQLGGDWAGGRTDLLFVF